MSNMQKVVITSDLLRVKSDLRSFHDVRIDKYFNLLNWQLKKAGWGEVIRLKSNHPRWNTRFFYELLGQKLEKEMDWVSVYDVKNISEKALDYYSSFIKDSLVIYIEASETIKRIHNILGVPYIDLTVHPIRYLDDQLFGCATNSTEISKILKKFSVDPNEFELGAHLISAQSVQRQLNVKPNSLLVVGQTKLDKSLISDGKLVDLRDFKDELVRLANDYENIYFKPHPYRKDNTELKAFLDTIKPTIMTNENIYHLLSSRNIKAVTGVSSSVIYEARFFDKKRQFLKKAFQFDYENNQISKRTYYSIGDSIFYPSMWSEILKSLGGKPCDCSFIPKHYPNRVRVALNDFWSQTEFDPSVRMAIKYFGKNIIKEEKPVSISTVQFSPKSLKQYWVHKLIRLFEKLPLGSNVIDLITLKAMIDFLRKKSHIFSSKPVTKIHCLTYRPEAPNGGRGGAGAVVSAMKKILGEHLGKYDMVYSFSEKDGVWHTKKNRYFNAQKFPVIFSEKSSLIMLWSAMAFARELTSKESAVYVTHEYGTAYALSLLRKKYVLVIHSQGPRLEEKDKLGEGVSWIGRKIITYCEKKAIEGAYKTYFPSVGARDSFFNSTYCHLQLDKLNVGRPLYNTLYCEPELEAVDSVFLNSNTNIKFLSVGTCTEAKGFDQSIDFLTSVVKATNKEIYWIWIGKGPLEEEVEEKAEKLAKSSSNFHFVHYRSLPYAQVQYCMTKADIYLMLHRKSIFDLATLEAMRASCALVLSPIEGNLEFNVCENVIYKNPNDPLDLEKLNIDELKDLNRKAYEQAFSNTNFKQQYTEIIEELAR